MSDTPRNPSVWLAPLLSLAAFVSYYLVIISRPALADLRDLPWPNLAVIALALVLSLRALPRAWSRGGVLRRTGAIAGLAVCTLCAGALPYYLFVATYRVPDVANALPPGEPIPAVTLLDHAEQPVDLAQLAQGDVVLVFYRGHW
jgi:hypothetical protein